MKLSISIDESLTIPDIVNCWAQANSPTAHHSGIATEVLHADVWQWGSCWLEESMLKLHKQLDYTKNIKNLVCHWHNCPLLLNWNQHGCCNVLDLMSSFLESIDAWASLDILISRQNALKWSISQFHAWHANIIDMSAPSREAFLLPSFLPTWMLSLARQVEPSTGEVLVDLLRPEFYKDTDQAHWTAVGILVIQGTALTMADQHQPFKENGGARKWLISLPKPSNYMQLSYLGWFRGAPSLDKLIWDKKKHGWTLLTSPSYVFAVFAVSFGDSKLGAKHSPIKQDRTRPDQ